MALPAAVVQLLLLVFLQPAHAQYEYFFEQKKPPVTLDSPDCTSDDRIDVLHYQIDYLIDPPANWFGGAVTITCRVLAESLTDVVLNVRTNLTVDSLGTPAESWELQGDDLQIQLDRAYLRDELLQLRVYDHGTGRHENYKGLRFETYSSDHPLEIAYSLSEPWGSAAWYACKDDPRDKADSLRLIYRVPEEYNAVGNGTLISETVAGGIRTQVWEQNYPISTYLVHAAVADYVGWDWVCTIEGEEIPLHIDVYPSKYDDAWQDFQDLPEMMEFYSELFGPYPFPEHGYNHVLVKGWTAMEHQTCTSYGQNFIQGNNHFDCVVAHELGHQWFGDLVTCDDWGDLWLNESFATWCDALWFGRDDPAGYHDRLLEMKEEYRDRQPWVDWLPTWDPPLDSLFNAHTYQRGAWILHMMREYIGETRFMASINRYLDRFALGSATTEQFFDCVLEDEPQLTEEIFRSWISSSGLPLFQYNWRLDDEGRVHLLIHQDESTSHGEYLTPFTLRLHGGTAGRDLQLLVDRKDAEFLFWPGMVVDSLHLDPDSTVFSDMVDTVSYEELAAIMAIEPETESVSLLPNPATYRLTLRTAGWQELAVYDLLGRLRLTQPPCESEEVITAYIDVSSLPAGFYALRLNQNGRYSHHKFLIVR